jgi:predicted metalloprotease with PDZ domain
MVTRDYQEPEQTRLLWIYEGLTDYLDIVLSTRSGLCGEDDFIDMMALYVQDTRNSRGRAWRSLDDTAASFNLFDRSRSDGALRRRSGWEVYVEGALTWLEVDCIIREQTKGRRSLDDFCRRFFGGQSGPPTVKTYTFDDVVADLNAIAPYEWAAMLTQRVAETTDRPLTAVIERAGWKLAYDKTSSRMQEMAEREWLDATDFTASIGITVKEDGTITDVVPDEPADRAEIGPGMKIVAVNMRRFTTEVLRSALAASEDPEATLELLIENADYFRSYTLDYHDGDKYACLKRDESKPDLLSEIIKPQAGAKKKAD